MMSVDVSPRYSLHHPLPTEMQVGVHNLFTRYKDYPVFSAGWWWRRTLLATLACAVLVFVPTFTGWVNIAPPLPVALVAFLTFLACVLSLSIGPGLAAVLRHRRLPRKREGVLIVIAIVVFAVVGRLVDHGLRELCFVIMQPYPETHAQSEILRKSLTPYAYLTSLIFFGALGGGWAIPAYFAELQRWQLLAQARREDVLRNQKLEADLRLRVLQAQVEPHFLFNTLASVRALIRQDPAQSEATLDALVGYLRASIPRLREAAGETTTTLGQQIELCAHFLEVMRIRTAGRLRCEVNVAPDLERLPFPPMLLITLVENAVKHGIEPRPGAGRVTISASRSGDRLRVCVEDDGLGLQPGIGGGLGLANVRSQLKALYGDRAGFEIAGRAEGGVRAAIEIPLPEREA